MRLYLRHFAWEKCFRRAWKNSYIILSYYRFMVYDRQRTLHRKKKNCNAASSEDLGMLPAVQDGNLWSSGYALNIEGAVAESRGDRDTNLRLHDVEPEQPDYDRLQRVHHSMHPRCLGWRKRMRDDHTLSYADALAKTASESREAIVRKPGILFALFVARMG